MADMADMLPFLSISTDCHSLSSVFPELIHLTSGSFCELVFCKYRNLSQPRQEEKRLEKKKIEEAKRASRTLAIIERIR